MSALPPFPWAQRDDVIAFDTPELTRVEYRLAPFGLRIVAAAIDRLLLLAVLLGIGLLLLVASIGLEVTLGGDAVLVVLTALVSAYLLFGTVLLAVAEVRGGGQTWGKRRLGIRTLTLAGQPPGIGAALVRNLARVVDDLPPLWIVPTLSAGRQRTGDLLAGTCVVVVTTSGARTDPIAWPARSWRELAERRFELPPEVARRLVQDDLDLVEYVLRRAQRHPHAVRREAMLRAIASRYLKRLGLEAMRPAAMADPRRFLGELGLMLKDRPAALAPGGACVSLELRDRDLGQLLATILEVATDQFGRLFLFELIGAIPLMALQLGFDPAGSLQGLQLDAPPEQVIPVLARFYAGLLLIVVVSVLLLPIQIGAATLLVQQLVEGRPPDAWACVKGSLRVWPRTMLLVVTWNVAATIGLMACVIPGLFIYAMFFVSPAVVVLERRLSWAAAFQRSRELAQGHYLENFVVYMATVYAPAMVLTPFILGASLLPGMAGTVVTQLLGLVTSLIPLVTYPICYYHLRTVNEALDVERLTALVDAIGARVDGVAPERGTSDVPA